MKKHALTNLFIMLGTVVMAQNNIGIGTQTPNPSSIMEVSSTSKGILVPRMTSAQRIAIAGPAPGLLVYDTTVKGFMFYNGTAWTAIAGSGGEGVFTVTGGVVHNTGDTATDHFVFGRKSLPGNNEVIEDNFMFFDKAKGALRAGHVVSEEPAWAPENVGNNSVAFGNSNYATGNGSAALGGYNIVQGNNSMAFGGFNTATGTSSMAINESNKAGGAFSLAGGRYNRANGTSTVAFGQNNTAHSYSSIALGQYNDSVTGSNINSWVETDPLLMIGNGTSNASRRNAITVLKNGNTGLGTSNPLTLLHLKRNSSQGYGHMILEETADNADGARITYKNSGSNMFWDLYGNTGIDLPGQARFNFNFTNPGISGRDVMTLTGIGLVGIGNNNPSATIDIQSAASSSIPQFRARVNSADYVRMRMANTVTPNSYWDIASLTSSGTTASANMNFFYFHNNQGGWNILSLQGNGNATLYGTLTQNSDERLKKNITAIENPLDALNRLNGYHYQWKDEWRDSATQTGLLAQEVEKAMPELVKEDEKGIKSVNYNGMIPYLLEAIKVLEAKIEKLEKRN